eukprot:TRINITY_DN5459_c0_g1_i18.p1 TRINITY_DN5459_c0_g1~~TRINITY_DN5459_c0_g1_i18.p1  ORF type:complete len:340 (+),score=58.83 TRINITY_DN5459_c0_g1_i18:48-1067(+)
MFGSRAVQQLVNNAENTIFEVKRLMGRNYDDIVVQDYKRRFKVKVSKHEPSGKPQFQVTFCNQIRKFLPEEISAMILGRLKEIAEEHLKCVVTQAVITVPAYFNDVQRQATVDAGRIAGLQVLRILTEPTAAAIAYGMDERSILQDQKAMVFDLGGGTFDVSILQLQQDILEVVAISGDTFLGGEDFKQKMVDKYLCMYKDEFGEDLNSYPEQFNMQAKTKQKISYWLEVQQEFQKQRVQQQNFSEERKDYAARQTQTRLLRKGLPYRPPHYKMSEVSQTHLYYKMSLLYRLVLLFQEAEWQLQSLKIPQYHYACKKISQLQFIINLLQGFRFIKGRGP